MLDTETGIFILFQYIQKMHKFTRNMWNAYKIDDSKGWEYIPGDNNWKVMNTEMEIRICAKYVKPLEKRLDIWYQQRCQKYSTKCSYCTIYIAKGKTNEVTDIASHWISWNFSNSWKSERGFFWKCEDWRIFRELFQCVLEGIVPQKSYPSAKKYFSMFVWPMRSDPKTRNTHWLFSW